MATLKICGVKNICITGVRKLTHLGNFDLEGDDRSDDAIWKAIENANLKLRDPLVHLTQFQQGDPTGVVFLIERERCYKEANEIYVFPYNAGFLMSDSGATIDRI